jgi:chemotaxis methyl-accepting protein methylase
MAPRPPTPAPADQDERGFRALTQKISRARGVTCEAYKEKCLRRRIAVRMRACGVHTFDEYSKLLDQDAKEYERLLDALTINVTKFYRNPETWNALLRPHLADLWRARNGHVRVWSAGCASGEEPYTLAVLLAETARLLDDGAALARARVDATDIDRLSLERTTTAEYEDAAFTEMPAELVRRYFSAEQPRRPIPDVRKLVHVSRHDLTRDRAPRPPYDLLVCRNVVIYFDRVNQEQVFARFVDSLAPGGLLVLGKVETLFGAARERLEMVDPRERIYRRPA